MLAFNRSPQSLGQVDNALNTKLWIGIAGRGVEGKQAPVVGGHKNASLIAVAPVGDATVVEAQVCRSTPLPCFGIE